MTPRELLLSGSRELGVSLTAAQVEDLFVFVTELKKWNRKINLTAITSEQDVVVKHLLDSLSYLRGLPAEQDLRLLDMGSGAGFPAIPIRIARPGLPVALVESVKKKASFLRHVCRSLGLTGVAVFDVRTDEVPASQDKAFSVVTARAFADMGSALSEGSRFLKAGGLVLLSRGPGETIEDRAVDQAGFAIVNRIRFALPHSDNERALWVFRKKEENG